MVKVKLVGYEEFTSKKGNVCVSISVLRPLEKRSSHTVCTGEKAVSYFVPDNLRNKVSVQDVGKELSIYTAFYGNSDNLIDIIR